MEIYDISFLGYSYDSDCIYINGTGVDEYEFFIQLNRCGTLGGSDHNKKRDANVKNTDPTVKNYMWRHIENRSDVKQKIHVTSKWNFLLSDGKKLHVTSFLKRNLILR